MIAHLIKNDIRSLRYRLCLWAGLLLLPVLGFSLLRGEPGWKPHYWSTLHYGLGILFVAQILTQLLLVVNLVQKENMNDGRAYWRTRPIPLGQLLVAKLGSTILCFLLPQLLQIGLMATLFPGDWPQVLRALGTGAIVFGGLLCVVIIAAGMTRTSGQALIGLIGVLVGLMVVEMLGFSYIRIPLQGALQRLLGEWVSVSVLLLVLFLMLGLLSFALRYLSQRPRRDSFWILGAAVLCVAFATNMDSSLRAPRVPEATMRLPEKAKLEVGSIRFLRQDRRTGGSTAISSEISGALWEGGGAGSAYGLSAHLEWSGLPEDWLVRTEVIRTLGPDGRRLLSWDTNRNAFDPAGFNSAFKRSLFPNSDPEARQGQMITWQRLFLSPDLQPSEIEWPATFSSGFATRVYRSEKVQLLLAEGERFELNGDRFFIERIDKTSDEMTITFRFLGTPPVAGYDSGWESGFFLIHESVSGETSFARSQGGTALTAFTFFQSGNFELRFRTESRSQKGLSGYELYFVHLELLGVEVHEADYTVPFEPAQYRFSSV